MLNRAEVEQAISPERFAKYLAVANGDDELAWETYRWNLNLIAAITPLIADTEVTLRNTIHRELTTRFGRPDWWTSPRIRLDEPTSDMLAPAVARMQRKIVKGSLDATAVVEAQTFGLWVHLLGNGTFTKTKQKARYEDHLWVAGVNRGFLIPGELNHRGLPKHPIRRHVHKRAQNAQALRNAAFHYRPIFEGVREPGRPPEHPRVTPQRLWSETIELLRWMSPPLADLHASDASFPAMLRSQPSP